MRRLPPCIVPHIRNGALRAAVAAAMAVIYAFFRMDNLRRGRFQFVIDTVGALVHTGAAFHACKIIDYRIPIFCHNIFLLIPAKIEKR
jgi:hypothetical protein